MPKPNPKPDLPTKANITKAAHVTKTAIFVVLPGVIVGVGSSIARFVIRLFR